MTCFVAVPVSSVQDSILGDIFPDFSSLVSDAEKPNCGLCNRGLEFLSCVRESLFLFVSDFHFTSRDSVVFKVEIYPGRQCGYFLVILWISLLYLVFL